MDNTHKVKTFEHKLKVKFEELFSFFKLTRKKRELAQEPKNLSTWIKHGLSEYFGTIFLSLALAGVSTYFGKEEFAEKYLIHPIIAGFYAGFIAVGLCLIFFIRWSCDLNPAVAISRYLNGTNTGRYVIYKVIIEMIAGITAGFLIYGSGRYFNPTGLANQPIDAFSSANKAFVHSSNPIAAGGVWIFFIEIVMTSILLFPIFSPNIRDKYRDILICFIISLSVWMGILGGSAAINPARGLAQQLPTLVFSGQFTDIVGVSTAATNNSGLNLHSVQIATVCMFLGSILSPVFYFLVQGVTKAFINPMFVGLIHYRNFKSSNMQFTNKK